MIKMLVRLYAVFALIGMFVFGLIEVSSFSYDRVSEALPMIARVLFYVASSLGLSGFIFSVVIRGGNIVSGLIFFYVSAYCLFEFYLPFLGGVLIGFREILGSTMAEVLEFMKELVLQFQTLPLLWILYRLWRSNMVAREVNSEPKC